MKPASALLATLSLAACRHAAPPPSAPVPPVVAVADAAPTASDASASNASASDAASITAAPACRSALATSAPTAPANADAFAPRPATAPALRTACAALARVTRLRLAPALQSFPAEERPRLLEPFVRCIDAGVGAWTFSVTLGAARAASQPGPRLHPVSVRAVYLSPDGAQHPASRAVALTLSAARFAHTSTLERVGVFDWDGDHKAELFFFESHSQEENGNEVARRERWWTFTARGATPAEYTPLAARASAIEDVDRDGRPDILLRSPWVVVGPCGISDVDMPGPRPLLHSAPDGTFLEDDASHAHLARECPERPARYFDSVTATDDVPEARRPPFLVACARLYGVSADEAAREVERTRPPTAADGNDPAACYPREELVRVARIDPPSAFRLQCDARP